MTAGGGGGGHLDNTEAGDGVAGGVGTDAHAEDPDISAVSPADQELQGLSLLVSEAPLVVLLGVEERGEGEREDERSGLDQEDGRDCLPVCHPRQSVSHCQAGLKTLHSTSGDLNVTTVGPGESQAGASRTYSSESNLHLSTSVECRV